MYYSNDAYRVAVEKAFQAAAKFQGKPEWEAEYILALALHGLKLVRTRFLQTYWIKGVTACYKIAPLSPTGAWPPATTITDGNLETPETWKSHVEKAERDVHT